MHELFFWMLEPPASTSGGAPPVDPSTWEAYLDSLAITTLATVAVATLLAIGVYCIWSRRIKIVKPEDQFKPYWPMLVLLNCLPAAGFAVFTVVSSYVIGSYEGTLGEGAPGQFITAVDVSAVCLALTFIVTLALLLGVAPLTPPRFRGRPYQAIKWLFPWTWWRG